MSEESRRRSLNERARPAFTLSLLSHATSVSSALGVQTNYTGGGPGPDLFLGAG